MASYWLKQRTGKPNAIGEKVREIAKLWRDYYHEPDAFQAERHFDALLHGVIRESSEINRLILPFLDREVAHLSPVERATMVGWEASPRSS